MIIVRDDGTLCNAGSETIAGTMPVMNAESPNKYESRSTLTSSIGAE